MEKQQEMPYQIWENKELIKLVTQEVYDKGYMQPQGTGPKPIFRMAPITTRKNVYWFKLAQKYRSETYFSDDTVQWGNDSHAVDEHGIQGRRSIMLAHFRLLHHIGFRKIYLLGVDFQMDAAKPYCYDRVKAPSACSQNNILYESLKVRLAVLYPEMLKAGLEVFNCNPNSKLEVFPYCSFEDALNDKDTCLHRN